MGQAMTDIVERLQTATADQFWRAVADDAIYEIKLLRGELGQVREILEDRETEIARLQAALERANDPTWPR
jgi:hypothetical protein